MFRDRKDAGRQLAARLGHLAKEAPLVLALPRGGVPVGYEVARALNAPLDVWIVRKLGAPFQQEYAIGAIGEGGTCYVDWPDAAEAGATRAYVDALVKRETLELQRRMRAYRGDRPRVDPRGRTVILVDDGIATGRSVRAALSDLRSLKPKKLVLATPVAPNASLRELAALADEVVCVDPTDALFAIGEWYFDFSQTTDEEVARLLDASPRIPESLPT
ncbi:MAG: phosphoribosyltransferase [Deltaproteobacteria bacterium]|nr:phosphoribosyltransferase [Deltaproteobacteria bacterium]